MHLFNFTLNPEVIDNKRELNLRFPEKVFSAKLKCIFFIFLCFFNRKDISNYCLIIKFLVIKISQIDHY